jgi:hypothetical protein
MTAKSIKLRRCYSASSEICGWGRNLTQILLDIEGHSEWRLLPDAGALATLNTNIQ